MTIEEYFGDWAKVIDKVEFVKILNWLKNVDKNSLCPSANNIFKAFKLCQYKDLHTIMLSQDPYPQKGVATGILFGNSKDTPEEKLSPSLQIIKEAAINYEIPHNLIEFDNTLESWAKQGILMINTAFTCEVGRVGSHYNIWRPFVSKLIQNISFRNSGLIFMLFGNQASSFKKDIIGNQHIIEAYHPAYYARIKSKMPHSIFQKWEDLYYNLYGNKLKLYGEIY